MRSRSGAKTTGRPERGSPPGRHSRGGVYRVATSGRATPANQRGPRRASHRSRRVSRDGFSTIVTALPVGKTSKWHDSTDRFGRIEEGYDPALHVARAYQLEIMGVYHSLNDCLTDSRIINAPEKFKRSVVCIKEVSGGDLDLWGYRFYLAGKVLVARKAALPNSPIRNPRRIHSAWIARWGEIDYNNGYKEQEAEQ